MASWDGFCFGSDKRSYNYLPSGYRGSNVNSFSGASVDWTCHPVSGPALQTPIDGLQPLNASVFTNQSLQPVFRLPFPSSFVDQNFQDKNTDGEYCVEFNTNLNPNEIRSEMVAASTLTPTAGEFVPRSTAVQLNSKLGGDAEEFDRNCRTATGECRPLTSNSYINCDQGSRTFRRHGGSDSKRFHSNRYPSSGPVRDVFHSNRRGNTWGTLQSTGANLKSYNMEKAKNQDRQRLLAEAAAFMTSSGNPDMTPVSDVYCNSGTEIQQQKINVSSLCQPKGRGEFRRTSMHPNKHNGDTSDVNFRNSVQQQQENFTQPKRRNDISHNQNKQGGFYNQRNAAVSETSSGNKLNHQYRLPNYNNGSSYRRTGASYCASPRKETEQHGEYSVNTAGNY
jgi:hypothetical protein